MSKTAMAVLAVVLAVGASVAQASSSVTVQVGATIREVQCTAEQRTRIRACAEGSQSMSTTPFKTLSAVNSDAGAPVEYRIESDPSRQVLVRTVLY